MRTISGVQPSGKLHLGNYYGAMRQWLGTQAEGDDALFFIADLHALTTVRDGALVRQLSLDVALDYLSLGLDPAQVVIFRQSDVTQHAELAWILGTVTPMALLERSHSYKDKVAHGIPADAGLFTYPVLMAADILLYAAHTVPVGQDQKQHLEITRDICTKFNVTYVPGYDPQDPEGTASGQPGILRLPAPHILADAAHVPGVDGQKMSKSYHNTIDLFAPDAVVKKRIMSIVTDSTPVEAPKTEPAALLTLMTTMADPSEAAAIRASWRAGGTGYGTYKKRLVELFHAALDPARARRRELEKNLDYVEQVLRDGADRARAACAPTWNKVVAAVGCGRPL